MSRKPSYLSLGNSLQGAATQALTHLPRAPWSIAGWGETTADVVDALDRPFLLGLPRRQAEAIALAAEAIEHLAREPDLQARLDDLEQQVTEAQDEASEARNDADGMQEELERAEGQLADFKRAWRLAAGFDTDRAWARRQARRMRLGRRPARRLRRMR